MSRRCQLMRLRAVRQHHPDLSCPVPRRFENDVASVWRPGGPFVSSGVSRNLDDLLGGHVHYVQVIVSTGPAPAESQQLPIR